MSEKISDDIIPELEKEAEREKALAFLRRYGVFIGLVIAIAAIGVAGRLIYGHMLENALENKAEAYFQAFDKFNKGDSGASDPVIADPENPYRHIAFLQKLSAAEQAGDGDRIIETAKNYNDIVLKKEAGAPSTLTADLAKLRAFYALADVTPDEAFFKQSEAVTADSFAFRASARELTAVKALKVKRYPLAREMLDKIKRDPRAPETLKQRADMFLQMIPEKQSEFSEKKDVNGKF